MNLQMRGCFVFPRHSWDYNCPNVCSPNCDWKFQGLLLNKYLTVYSEPLSAGPPLSVAIPVSINVFLDWNWTRTISRDRNQSLTPKQPEDWWMTPSRTLQQSKTKYWLILRDRRDSVWWRKADSDSLELENRKPESWCDQTVSDPGPEAVWHQTEGGCERIRQNQEWSDEELQIR